MLPKKFQFALGLLILTISLNVRAVVLQTLETQDLEDVKIAFAKLARGTTPNKILVVTDLDNTLLATDTDLGSEHWYLWQKTIIEEGLTTFPAVAKTVDQMLAVQDLIVFLQKMHPTAAGLPSFYQELQAKGAGRMVLTSRGPTTHDATLREISRNQIALSSEAELGLGSGSISGFDRGVYLTSGKHKGETLRVFLRTASRKFDAILFMDDRPHHIQGMNDVFSQEPEQLISIRFTPVIKEIEAFNRSDKQTVKNQWCQLAAGLEHGFPFSAMNVEFVGCH